MAVSSPTRVTQTLVCCAAATAPGTTALGPISPPMASTAIIIGGLVIGFDYGTSLIGSTFRAGAVRQAGFAALTINNGRYRHTVVRAAHTLSGSGFFVLLNSHVRSPENYTLKVAGLVWQGF